MKISEIFISKDNYNPRRRDIHVPEQSLPTKEIKQAVDTMYSTDIPYLDILKKVNSDFGEEAMFWAKKYIKQKNNI